MIHDSRQARNKLCCGDSLIFGLMRQHWTGADVAHGIDTRYARLEIMADLNLATRVDAKPGLIKRKAIGICAATNGDEDAIRLYGFACTACCRFNGQRCRSAFDRCAGYFRAGADVEALLLENLRGFLADFTVHAGQYLVEIFNDGYLRAKAQPHAAEFKANHTAADHDQMLWHFGQGQCAG